MSSVSQQVNEYLQYELFHLLGAYGIAEKRMRELELELGEPGRTQQENEESPEIRAEPRHLSDLAKMASRYNHLLGWYRHGLPVERDDCVGQDDEADGPGRHESQAHSRPSRLKRDPVPDELPLTQDVRFRTQGNDRGFQSARRNPWGKPNIWERIPKFYGEAIHALESYNPLTEVNPPTGESNERERDSWRVHNFAKSLTALRDGASSGSPQAPSDRVGEVQDRVWRRQDRYEHRLKDAIALLDPAAGTPMETGSYPHDPAFTKELVTDHLSTGGDSLPIFVIRVLSEAHLSMHGVEAWQSMGLAEHAEMLRKSEREWLELELDRCIVLNTFTYSISRTSPWIFAADKREADDVFGNLPSAWENVVPARGLWIAGQVSLLSLHRRAYAYGLKGEPTKAYNDYHKLQRLIRDAERRVRAAPIQVDGALEFLSALDAQAHHHIGELYRAEHAHRPARKHFDAATHRLKLLREEEKMGDVLTNSRWYVELQVSHGKASYEMGHHKEALCWHLRGWRSFLHLLAADTKTVTNTQAVTAAIGWLERVKYEPELRKVDVVKNIGPVVRQLERVTVSRRYGALAGEILLRLGHLLFVLNLKESCSTPDADAWEHPSGTLAFACLQKAAECDEHSTLIASDLLKARFRSEAVVAKHASTAGKEQSFTPVTAQWPRGGNDYERLARVAEYLILRAQLGWKPPRPQSEAADNELIARDLLLNLFRNTDSIDVRKSQVHHLMMRKPPGDLPPDEDETPAVEFVCMRRYSSALPLLPRPSAFRALGGGYFIRLHGKSPQSHAEGPFGIVIDPGVDFVENLYRTGYSLSDVKMIIVSHDHVDHVGALDPLISLLHMRSRLLKDEDKSKALEPVTILASKSVRTRYVEAKQLFEARDDRPPEFVFQVIEEQIRPKGRASGVLRQVRGLPAGFEIVAMSTADINGEINGEINPRAGHLDLSLRPAFGICLRVKGGRSSVAIAGDTPPPPQPSDPKNYTRWRRAWGPALEADVLVAHLSSVPLTELRQLISTSSGDAPDQSSLADDAKDLEDIRGKLQLADKRLSAQVEYGLWLRSRTHRESDTAPLVGEVPEGWAPPSQHSFLLGMLGWARAYKEIRGPARPGLFVIGELSEELGTMRVKIASRINERIFKVPVGERIEGVRGAPPGKHVNKLTYALTGDIGLRVYVTPSKSAGSRAPSLVRVLCTTCNLDTDRVLAERYHVAHDVLETCVKGENEGIFYNCFEHAPSMQEGETFLEQLERFDIFGR